MQYLLDTHILIWHLQNSNKLPQKYFDIIQQIESSQEKLAISIITLWEIAKLVELKKIKFDYSIDQLLIHLESHPSLEVLPINSFIILDSTRLGDHFPKDPVDQIIAATCRHHLLNLITCDQKIIEANVVGVA